MSVINDWALLWGVPPEALDDLRRRVCNTGEPGSVAPDKSEAWAQSVARLQAAQQGAILWRNNVGACMDAERGRMIRYGLANESKAQNLVFKSSDLIGLRAVTVTPSMVGTVIGQFVAREIKAPGWKPSGSAREVAQGSFISTVNALGGDAAFFTGEGPLF